MRFPSPIPLDEVIGFIGHSVDTVGHASTPVLGLNEMHSVEEGELTFVDCDKYYNRVLQSKATFIIINRTEIACPEGKVLIFSEDPLIDYLSIVQHFIHFEPQSSTIHPTAQIGEGTVVQPLVFIGENVKIGKNCLIHSNVSIYADTEIGDNVIIHSNSTIGGDACYFQKRPDKWVKLDSCGRTVIGNDVEIGCGCCIDKGVSGTTYIGDGTKFDNLVQVGHDTHIGKRVLLGAQSGIAGCTYIDDDCKIWAKASVNKDLYVAKNTVLYALSALDKSIHEEGTTLFGVPAIDAQTKWKELIYVKNLPKLYSEVSELKKSEQTK